MKASGLENHVFWATIVKTHGVKGEIILKTENDFIEDLNDLQPVFILVDAKPVPFFVDHQITRWKSQEFLYLKLEYLDTLQQAEKLLQCAVHVPERLVKKEQQSPDFFALLNYSLYAADNSFVGIIEDFLDIHNNPLLQVNVQQREVLIPFVEEWLLDINHEKKILKLDFPADLLSLEE